jgi:hypothetical protein
VVAHPFAEEVTDWVVEDEIEVTEILVGEESKQIKGSKGLIAAARQTPANAGKVRSFIRRD